MLLNIYSGMLCETGRQTVTGTASFTATARSSNAKVVDMMCKDIMSTNKSTGLAGVFAMAAPVQGIIDV